MLLFERNMKDDIASASSTPGSVSTVGSDLEYQAKQLMANVRTDDRNSARFDRHSYGPLEPPKV